MYETDGELFLPDVIDLDTSYLHGGGTTYYEMTATSGDGVERLRSERVRPKRTSLPAIINRMETDTGGCTFVQIFATPGWRITAVCYSHQYELTVDTRITSADELVFEDAVTLASGTESDLGDGTTYGYGGYQAELAISTGTEAREKTVGWRVNHIHGLGDIVISADDVQMTDGPTAERRGVSGTTRGNS